MSHDPEPHAQTNCEQDQHQPDKGSAIAPVETLPIALPPPTRSTPSSADTDTFTAFLKSETAHQARAAALRDGNKQALLAGLSAAGVAKLTVTFDGYGDSGQIEEVAAVAGDASPVALPAALMVRISTAVWDRPDLAEHELSLSEAVERFVYDLLGTLHGGWEINEGSHGEVTMDVAAATITLEMNTRFVSSEQHITMI